MAGQRALMLEGYLPQYFLGCRGCLIACKLTCQPPTTWDTESESLPFLLAHGAHPLETLTRTGTEILSDRPVWDPLAVTYVEVTNGGDVFLLCSRRESIDQPVERTLLSGRLLCNRVDVEADWQLLRRGLDAHFYPQVFPSRRSEGLRAILDGVLGGVDPGSLVILHDADSDPNVSIARFPPPLLPVVLARCAESFAGWELLRVREFLSRHAEDDGLLCLRVRRTLELHPG